MNNRRVLILSVEEAREALFQFHADSLDEPEFRLEIIRTGNLSRIAETRTWCGEQVANEYGELDLGCDLLKSNPDIDLVLVETAKYAFLEVASRSAGPS